MDPDYTISYVAGTLTVTPAALTITADNQTQGLRGGAADPDGQLQRVCQRRHARQPDHAADGHHHGHGRQPRAAVYCDHGQRGGRCGLHDQLRGRDADRDPGGADDHGGQPEQGLRGGVPTLTASYTGFVNGDTSASLTTQPTVATTATAASASTVGSLCGHGDTAVYAHRQYTDHTGRVTRPSAGHATTTAIVRLRPIPRCSAKRSTPHGDLAYEPDAGVRPRER